MDRSSRNFHQNSGEGVSLKTLMFRKIMDTAYGFTQPTCRDHDHQKQHSSQLKTIRKQSFPAAEGYFIYISQPYNNYFININN